MPHVAMSRPPLRASIEMPDTGPRCASSFTAGVDRLGVHSVTVPFEWPRCSTAVSGFCVMVLQLPNPVRCWLISVPVDVSWYLR